MKWHRLRSWLLGRVFISGMGAALMGRDEWRVKKRCDVSKLEEVRKRKPPQTPPPAKKTEKQKKTRKWSKMHNGLETRESILAPALQKDGSFSVRVSACEEREPYMDIYARGHAARYARRIKCTCAHTSIKPLCVLKQRAHTKASRRSQTRTHARARARARGAGLSTASKKNTAARR